MSALVRYELTEIHCAKAPILLPQNEVWHGSSRRDMIRNGQEEVRAALAGQLLRLWRYSLVLAGRRDVAEDLVQATCLRALERAHQYEAGTRLDHWLFAILRSIWQNEIRARRIRQGEGVIDAETALSFDGERLAEMNVLAGQVLKEVRALPEAQREAVFLVYVEGFAYREAAEVLAVPIGTIMSRLAAARTRLAKLQVEHLGAHSSVEVKKQ